MRIQREAFACVVEKPLSWLVGKHPFRYTRCVNHLYVAESRHFRRIESLVREQYEICFFERNLIWCKEINSNILFPGR